jgi:hypothetical protein
VDFPAARAMTEIQSARSRLTDSDDAEFLRSMVSTVPGLRLRCSNSRRTAGLRIGNAADSRMFLERPLGERHFLAVDAGRAFLGGITCPCGTISGSARIAATRSSKRSEMKCSSRSASSCTSSQEAAAGRAEAHARHQDDRQARNPFQHQATVRFRSQQPTIQSQAVPVHSRVAFGLRTPLCAQRPPESGNVQACKGFSSGDEAALCLIGERPLECDFCCHRF